MQPAQSAASLWHNAWMSPLELASSISQTTFQPEVVSGHRWNAFYRIVLVIFSVPLPIRGFDCTWKTQRLVEKPTTW